jgi:hypothetical protein
VVDSAGVVSFTYLLRRNLHSEQDAARASLSVLFDHLPSFGVALEDVDVDQDGTVRVTVSEALPGEQAEHLDLT